MPVDCGLALAEQIEVGSVDDADKSIHAQILRNAWARSIEQRDRAGLLPRERVGRAHDSREHDSRVRRGVFFSAAGGNILEISHDDILGAVRDLPWPIRTPNGKTTREARVSGARCRGAGLIVT